MLKETSCFTETLKKRGLTSRCHKITLIKGEIKSIVYFVLCGLILLAGLVRIARINIFKTVSKQLCKSMAYTCCYNKAELG